MKIKSKLFQALTVLVIGTTLFASCGPSKKEKEEQAQTVKDVDAVDTPSVQLYTAKKGRLSTTIAVPGELIPYQEVDLYAKIGSYVKKLWVDIGSEVHEGQLLVTLEAPEINAQLGEAKSRIQQQQAVYYADKATYDRLYNTSKTPGTVSQNDLEQAEAKEKSDLANVEAAKSAYNTVAANLAYLQIKAPFDGVITARNVNLGAYVSASGADTGPLMILQDQQRMRLAVSVPEDYTGGLTDKDRVTFSVRSMPNKKFTAQVRRLAGALDVRLRSERIEMDVFNKDRTLLPHMFAEVDVPLPSRDSAVIVPKTAVVTSTEKVFIIRVANNKAEWVDVKKGISSGDMMEIYGEVKAGDQIVKKGTEEVRDGSPVKEDNSKGDSSKKDSTNKGNSNSKNDSTKKS